MKPIRLSFSGLHSYRDTQHVDFTQLCEGGLFGIFGPTGSGKSTVLDAITLALYARVDRATGGRQGIMNDSVDDLAVSFTFEIGQGSERRRYCAERRYKRSGPHNIRIAHARLTQETKPEPTVLADKDSDVTAAIGTIIGLEFDDFTRAVVLPQGKFAQFIAMTGGDRRKMLERLFGLEQFGQQLADKVRNQLRRAEHELDKIASEQAGLGDASAERVAELEKSVQQALAAVAAADEQRRTVTERLRKAEHQRELQSALKQVQGQLQPLLAAQADVDEKRQLLHRADLAEPLRSLIEKTDELETELIRAKREATEAAAAWNAAESGTTHAEEAVAKAKAERQKQAPDLTAKKLALESAVQDEHRLQQKKTKLDALHKEIAEVRKTKATLHEQKKDQSNQLQSLAAQRQQLLDEREALTVSPSHRRRIDAAALATERLHDAETALAAARHELKQRTDALDQAKAVYERHNKSVLFSQKQLEQKEAELEQLQTSPPADDDQLTRDVTFIEQMRGMSDQLHSLYAEKKAAQATLTEAKQQRDTMEALYGAAVAKQHELQQHLAAAQNMLQATEEAAAGHEQAHEAAVLAATLHPGSPCPVCGSKHHPQPATADDEAWKQWRQAEAKATELKDRYSAAQHEAELAEANRRHAQTEVDNKQLALNTVGNRIAEIRAHLPNKWRKLSLPELDLALQAEAETAKQLQQRVREWQQSVRQLQTECNEARQGTATYQKEAERAGRQLAAAEAQQQTANRQVERAQQLFAEATVTFDDAARGMTPAAIRHAVETIQANDDRAEKLFADSKRITDQLPALEQRLIATESAYNDAVALVQKRENEAFVLKSDADRLGVQIHHVTEGGSTTDMLEQVNRALQQLNDDEAEAAEQYEAARQATAVAQQQCAVAADRLDRLTADMNKTAQQLATRVTEAGFSAVQHARSALLPEAKRSELAADIGAHTTAVQQLTVRHDELETQLGGDIVTDEMWRDVTKHAETMEKAYHDARDASVATKTTYDDTKKKHARWDTLARQQHRIESVKKRLDQLNTLLRGNRFVDFVAEEYLSDVVRAASVHLGALTRQRYALELDTEGAFVIRDDANGGIRRPISSLSGGETFITSLALALALSNQIQLHGEYPLEFFFLDEGFGTLDPDLLETVIVSLEKLQNERVSIGLISHVPELRPRVARRLIVTPAGPGTEGSQLVFERG